MKTITSSPTTTSLDLTHTQSVVSMTSFVIQIVFVLLFVSSSFYKYRNPYFQHLIETHCCNAISIVVSGLTFTSCLVWGIYFQLMYGEDAFIAWVILFFVIVCNLMLVFLICTSTSTNGIIQSKGYFRFCRYFFTIFIGYCALLYTSGLYKHHVYLLRIFVVTMEMILKNFLTIVVVGFTYSDTNQDTYADIYLDDPMFNTILMILFTTNTVSIFWFLCIFIVAKDNERSEYQRREDHEQRSIASHQLNPQ
jgi:hypothetical protein